MSNPNNVNNEDEIFDPQEMFVTLDLDLTFPAGMSDSDHL